MGSTIYKLYAGIKTAKNGSPVPYFADGRSMHSVYNPEQEADGFGAVKDNNCHFFIVLGLGGGYHVQALAKKYPDAEIMVIENSSEDIQLTAGIPTVSMLRTIPRIHIFTAKAAEGKLHQLYIPALHGNLQLLSQRVWVEENTDTAEKIKQMIKYDLKKISADYSVQSHFGAIWQRNVIQNLKQAARVSKPGCFPTERTAAIIAAGPSLDKTAGELTQNRNKYYIIATDTAYGALQRRGIDSDIVISIDGQQISVRHFTGPVSEKTLFVFDVCANPAAVRRVLDSGGRILFVQTGHPLAQYACTTGSTIAFTHLEAGTGTVTIAAADFARKAGFRLIRFFGADFSYHGGKPYTSGTYLDSIYGCSSGRLCPAEQLFATLMYRTPLIPLDSDKNAYTTTVLDSYRSSLSEWQNHSEPAGSAFFQKTDFDFSLFRQKLLHDIQPGTDGTCPVLPAVLPYISFLRREDSRNGMTRKFSMLLKLAYSNAVRYTELP